MMRAALLLVVLTGCDALFGLVPVPSNQDSSDDGAMRGDAPSADAVGDDSLDCVGTYLSMCPTFATSYNFNAVTTIDTSTDTRCTFLAPMANGYPGVCVIAADAINVSGQVTVTGSRAIAFAARFSITVTSTGTINASSVGRGQNGGAGPAANASGSLGCSANKGTKQASTNAGGAGGGAGGSFYGLGGYGGVSDTSTKALPNIAVSTAPMLLRGGCAGGGGGQSLDGSAAGLDGSSGGAIYLATSGSITIAGAVLANGGGGGSPGAASSGQNAGGGGGGSGGLIVLDAATLDLSGYVVAMGAGGGGGGSGPSGGAAGEDWSPLSPLTAPSGGTGGAAGGAGSGGPGSSPTVYDGSVGGSYDNQTAGGGAGGGGGGAGFILTHGSVSQASHVYPSAIAVQ